MPDVQTSPAPKTSTEPTSFPWGRFASMAVIVCSATWLVANTAITSKYEGQIAAQTWKLPETLEKMRALSVALEKQASDAVELVRLREEATKAAAIALELEAARKAAEALTKRLRSYEGDSFELSEGHTRFLVAKKVAIGLYSISKDSCFIAIGQKNSRPLTVGEYIIVPETQERMRVTLLSKTMLSCVFAVNEE